MDNQHISLLILLDSSAAFDTVNQPPCYVDLSTHLVYREKLSHGLHPTYADNNYCLFSHYLNLLN